MKIVVLAAAAVMSIGVLGTAVGTAEAAQGCGPGFHRNGWGYCRPSFGYAPAYGYGHGWHHGGWHRDWHHWHHWRRW